jgi:hypothetical protein
MRRLALVSILCMGALGGPVDAQIFQGGMNNFAIVTTGGQDTNLTIGQVGVANYFYGVQQANNSNSAIVSQVGFTSNSQLTQLNQNGLNDAYVNQVGAFTHSELTQFGNTNIAGVAQNSNVRDAPQVTGLPTPGANGPSFRTYQTADGFLTQFTTDGMNLVTMTSGGMTVMTNFGRQH